MSEPSVLESLDERVLTVTLNRPALLNALDDDLLLRLRAALDRAAAGCADGTVRAVLLTGAGRGFSSGADLQLVGSAMAQADLDRHLREEFHPVILGMRALPAPIVAAVNGVAAGAGMSLALASDVVLAGRSATFLQAFSKIGLIPDAGSTWLLPRLVGDGRTRALAMLADRIDAATAERFGLVWQVHDDDALLPAARAMAARLAAMPTAAIALIKQALDATATNDLATQLDLEATLQARAALTDDFREGVAAFLSKRPPDFKGR